MPHPPCNAAAEPEIEVLTDVAVDVLVEAQLWQAEEVLYSLARRADEGDTAAFARAPFAKLLATRNAVTAVQTAVAALGNPALTHHNPIERHLRDVLCCRIHPPQDDMALIILGKQALARQVG